MRGAGVGYRSLSETTFHSLFCGVLICSVVKSIFPDPTPGMDTTTHCWHCARVLSSAAQVLDKRYEMNGELPGGASFEKIAKVYNRMGSCYQRQKQFDTVPAGDAHGASTRRCLASW